MTEHINKFLNLNMSKKFFSYKKTSIPNLLTSSNINFLFLFFFPKNKHI